jgi:hypothetical protein
MNMPATVAREKVVLGVLPSATDFLHATEDGISRATFSVDLPETQLHTLDSLAAALGASSVAISGQVSESSAAIQLTVRW